MHFLLPLSPNWRSADLPELNQLEAALMKPAAQSATTFMLDAIVLLLFTLYRKFHQLVIPDLLEDDDNEVAPRIGRWCYHSGPLLCEDEACATVYGSKYDLHMNLSCQRLAWQLRREWLSCAMV